MQQLRERLRSLNLRFVEEPGARALQRIGFTPNAVTLLGFLVTCVAAVLVAMGHLRIGALVFLAGGALDLFDGALARLSNKTTPFGAMLDSLMDRLGEAALYLGLTIYALSVDPDSRNLTLFMSLLILALATSPGRQLPPREGGIARHRHPRRPHDPPRNGSLSSSLAYSWARQPSC